ncbi:four helix bundle protein [Deinococcus misasensis]|uniref:four helix bundle protein n=1 Tax=Deinococcus misasensis TaxID=392413 RepID=UPI00068DF237|nr:four helix bundle protein [Deinococcus misasensis]
MRNFRELLVWQKAHQLVLEVYQLTKSFPVEERFGITSQLRRSVVSIPTNIAEGAGMGTELQMGRYLQIALGSASETEYLLLRSQDLGYLPNQEGVTLVGKVQEMKRMLSGFIVKLKGCADAGTLTADR